MKYIKSPRVIHLNTRCAKKNHSTKCNVKYL